MKPTVIVLSILAVVGAGIWFFIARPNNTIHVAELTTGGYYYNTRGQGWKYAATPTDVAKSIGVLYCPRGELVLGCLFDYVEKSDYVSNSREQAQLLGGVVQPEFVRFYNIYRLY